MSRRWNRLLIFISIIVILLVGGLFLFGVIGPKGSDQQYRMVKVERGEISSTVTATGTINPVVTVLVGSQISGKIKALYADFNSPVKEGQTIAQIDPETFEAQVDQGRAGVISAQADLSNALANLQNAQANLAKNEVAVIDTKKNLERNQKLMEMKAIAQSSLDTSQANYDSAVAQRDAARAQIEVAKSQVESAKAQVERAKASLKVSEINLRYTTIPSPVNGIVISRNVDVGQTVAASLQAPTLFTIAKDLTQMQVDTNFSEADIGSIEKGQEATFTIDAYPERTFRGKVSEVRNAPTIIQNVVTYDVVIQVNNQDLKLKPGMTANVTVVISHKEEALKIPNAALRFQPQNLMRQKIRGVLTAEQKQKLVKATLSSQTEREKPGRVWILSPEGKPSPVSIGLGITNGTFSEVVSDDIKEGTELIVEETSKKNNQTSNTSRLPFMPGPRR